MQVVVFEFLHLIGIGLLDSIQDDEENEEDGNAGGDSRQWAGSCAFSIKELLEKYRKPDDSLENKTYSRLLLPDEFVVKESYVWKRKGWSIRYRFLILTNKPRLFYTTKSGQFKGIIPWSMTEPIEIKKIDNTHFDISLHSSSRIYHFNDKVSGSAEWVEIISEVITHINSYMFYVFHSGIYILSQSFSRFSDIRVLETIFVRKCA